MARQIDTVSIYLIVRRNADGSYMRDLQRVSAVASDPAPATSLDKAPIVVEDANFGVTFDETVTVKSMLDSLVAAVAAKTGVSVFTDYVINRTTFQFINNVDGKSYDPKVWLVNPNLDSVSGVPKQYWQVVGDTVVEMDANQKAVADAGILQSSIDAAVASWTTAINQFVGAHYNLGQQQTLQTCWMEALSKGWKNRSDMVQQVWDWIQTALDYFYAQRTAMWDAKNLDELNAVKRDLSQFEGTDPKVIVETVDKTTN